MMTIMNNALVSVNARGGTVVEFGFKTLKKFNKTKCRKIRIQRQDCKTHEKALSDDEQKPWKSCVFQKYLVTEVHNKRCNYSTRHLKYTCSNIHTRQIKEHP